jgi:hypothetical protein
MDYTRTTLLQAYLPLKGQISQYALSMYFSLTQSFPSYYGPGVDSASKRNEYQEYFLGGKGGQCLRLTTLPHSCADCLEILKPQPPGTLRPGQASNGIALPLLSMYVYIPKGRSGFKNVQHLNDADSLGKGLVITLLVYKTFRIRAYNRFEIF